MAFKSIERMFSKELRDSVKVESIIRDQTEGWRRLRDTHPSMAYLFDEFTNRRYDKTIESVSDFVRLVFDIIRSMQRACKIAVKLGYTCAPKQSDKINLKSTLPSGKPPGDTKGIGKNVRTPKITCYMCGR
jgi:hypothetical protein